MSQEARAFETGPGGERGSEPTDGAVARVVSWLRDGYPDGVPPQDYGALLGLLQRSLTESEVESVVRRLVDDAGAHQTLVNRQVIEQRIADVLKGPGLDEDIGRVSARLASAGWPLAPLHPDAEAAGAASLTPRTNLVSRVVDWLRAGYPAGVDEHDYIALVALLRRRLTDAEVIEVGKQLVRHGVIPPDRVDVGTAITRVTSELPSDEDIDRVRRYLTDHGWPGDLSV